MKRGAILGTVVVALICLTLTAAVTQGDPDSRAGTAKLRVGVYDSRAIAAAHFGKAIRDGQLAKLYAEHGKAKASGDEKRAEELADSSPRGTAQRPKL